MNERGYPEQRPAAEPVERISELAQNDRLYQKHLAEKRTELHATQESRGRHGNLKGLLMSGTLATSLALGAFFYGTLKSEFIGQPDTGEAESKTIKHERWGWSESGMRAGAKLTEVDGVRVLTVMLDTSPPKILKGITSVPKIMGAITEIRVTDILNSGDIVGHNIVITYENGATTRIKIDPKGGLDGMLNSWSY